MTSLRRHASEVNDEWLSQHFRKELDPMTSAELNEWWECRWPHCGCGEPQAVAELLLRALDILAAEPPAEKWSLFHDLLGREEGIYWQYLYLLDDRGLEEHGGASPGWLTPLGVQIRAALREHGCDPSAWEYIPEARWEAWQPVAQAEKTARPEWFR